MFRKPGHVSAKLSSLRGPGSGVPTSLITNRHLAGTYVGDSVVTLSSGAAPATFYTDLVDLGFSTNLKLVLDAGAAASYSSGQKWLDLAGGGYDFFRGSSASAASDDPTFNGTPGGSSSSEYWGFDGGDVFTYDTTNETWMTNMAEDGAQFTIIMWVYTGGAGNNAFAGTGASSGTSWNFHEDGGGKINWVVRNSGTSVLEIKRGDALATGAWKMVSVRMVEATPVADIGIDTDYTNFTSGYSSPPSGAHATSMKFSDFGGGDLFKSGGRIAAVFMWEGSALSTANITTIFNATKTRFGL